MTSDIFTLINYFYLTIICFFLSTAACSLKLDTLLRLVNTLIINQEHFTTQPSEPSRCSRPLHQNLLPVFPLINLLQLEQFNQLLKDNNAARAQYVNNYFIT